MLLCLYILIYSAPGRHLGYSPAWESSKMVLWTQQVISPAHLYTHFCEGRSWEWSYDSWSWYVFSFCGYCQSSKLIQFHSYIISSLSIIITTKSHRYPKIMLIYLLAYSSGSQKSKLGFNMTKISSCGAVLVLEGCGEKNLFSLPLVTFKGCLEFLSFSSLFLHIMFRSLSPAPSVCVCAHACMRLSLSLCPSVISLPLSFLSPHSSALACLFLPRTLCILLTWLSCLALGNYLRNCTGLTWIICHLEIHNLITPTKFLSPHNVTYS